MVDPRCEFGGLPFLAIPAERFIDEVILERFQPVAMVEGASFGFGHRRQGNVNTLREAAERHGFEAEVVEPVRVELGGHPGTVISSSLIRHLLKSGTVDQAALCLGRPYALFGQVVHGVGRGQPLGLATANLAVEAQLIPAEGVYAGQAEVDHRLWAAAVSIGRKSTFGERDLAVEAHLLDFTGDLYGRHLRLELREWLRPQERFGAPQSLRQQMARDVARTREVLKTDAAIG